MVGELVGVRLGVNVGVGVAVEVGEGVRVTLGGALLEIIGEALGVNVALAVADGVGAADVAVGLRRAGKRRVTRYNPPQSPKITTITKPIALITRSRDVFCLRARLQFQQTLRRCGLSCLQWVQRQFSDIAL